MQDIEAQQLLTEILDYAQEGKNIEFQFIKTWADFNFYRQRSRSTKLIIKTLRSSSKKLFNSYCKNVIAGISDVNKILAYARLREVITFYERELETIKRMLDDYDEYLGHGNFWHSFLGGERKYYYQKDEGIWNIH